MPSCIKLRLKGTQLLHYGIFCAFSTADPAFHLFELLCGSLHHFRILFELFIDFFNFSQLLLQFRQVLTVALLQFFKLITDPDKFRNSSITAGILPPCKFNIVRGDFIPFLLQPVQTGAERSVGIGSRFV